MTGTSLYQPLVLEFREVGFGYSPEQSLFSNLNLGVSLGEFVSIVGMSGAGKSTLLKLAGGLLKPAVGTVTSQGIVRTVFQQNNLFPWFSVLSNVTLGALSTGESANVIEDRAMLLLDALGLENKAMESVSSLSGGEQQRVGIARAFVANPSLVLMDEPFGALDEMKRTSAQNLLMDFRKDKNAGILFVTHSIEEAILLGDRVAVVDGTKQLCEYKVPFNRHRPPETIFERDFIDLRRQITAHFKN